MLCSSCQNRTNEYSLSLLIYQHRHALIYRAHNVKINLKCADCSKAPTVLLCFLFVWSHQRMYVFITQPSGIGGYRCWYRLQYRRYRYRWYRPIPDTEYWYRSKPSLLSCGVKLFWSAVPFPEWLIMCWAGCRTVLTQSLCQQLRLWQGLK